AVFTLDRRLAVETDEPLRGGQEDHGVVAAPAVRILVRDRVAVPQPAALVQRLLDVRIGVEDTLAREQADAVEEMSAGADGRVDVEPVPDAREEVVGAMSRRRVDGARALLERDV